MGDEQTNMGSGACGVAKRGTRRLGEERAIELATLYPGIDGATMGWVHIGGKIYSKNGLWHVVDAEGFAKFLFASKLPTRASEAVKRKNNNMIECPQGVVRSVKATGYRVHGGGCFPQPDPVAGTVAGANYAKPDTVVSSAVAFEDGGVGKSKVVMMPEDFMTDFLEGDD